VERAELNAKVRAPSD